MGLQALVEASGYALGTLLHAVLLGLIWRRPLRRRGELLFALLAASLLVWNAANLTGALATALFARPLPRFLAATEFVAYAGLALAPSLLLHGLILFVIRPDASTARKALLTAPLYWPAAALALTWTVPFRIWYVLALMLASALAYEVGRRSAGRAFAGPEATPFYRAVALTILAAAAAAVLFFFWLWRGSPERPRLALSLATIVASNAPSVAIAFHVYRYYRVRALVRRGLIYAIVGLGVVLVYLTGVSSLSRALAETYRLDARTIEALFIVFVAFLVHRFRRSLQQGFGRLLVPEAEQARRLRDLARELARPGVSSAEALATRASEGVAEALALERAGVAIAVPDGRRIAAAHPPRWLPWERLVGDELDADLAQDVRGAGVERIVPLRYEGRTVGVLALGRRRDGFPLDQDDLAPVEAVAGTLAVAAASASLLEEKIALERRLRDEERLASLGRLSASVAHRVKNPLSSIKALSQALREDLPADDPRRQDLSLILGEVDRLAQVTGQLLQFARPAPAEVAAVDLAALAEDLVLLFGHQAGAQGVAVDLDVPAGLPRVAADAGGLREALANLVENALEAMPRGGTLRVTASTAAAADGDGEPRVRLVVADTGPGIPAAERGRIFEPFYTTRPGGTGLGLAIARSRLEALGGRIAAGENARDGRGAAFTIELRPAAAPAQAQAAAPGPPVSVA